jgi:fibronectin type 3 domain-containing protein
VEVKVWKIFQSAVPQIMVRVLVLLLCTSWQITACLGQTTDRANGAAQSSEEAKKASTTQEVKNALVPPSLLSRQSANSQPPVSPSVTLTWTASVSANKPSSDPVIGYNVYRGTNSAPDYTKPIAFVSVKDTTYVDVSVGRGKKYSYTVKTVTAGKAESVASNQADANITAH